MIRIFVFLFYKHVSHNRSNFRTDIKNYFIDGKLDLFWVILSYVTYAFADKFAS